jgi:hypothetical protein
MGDLRPYVLVQFLPILLIPLIIIMFPSRFTHTYLLWLLMAGYAMAKVFEVLDVPIYNAIGLSGHTLKHLAAAVGVFTFAIAIRSRRHRDSTLPAVET